MAPTVVQSGAAPAPRRAAPSAKIVSAHFGCTETADGRAGSVNSPFNFHSGAPKN